jgi:hypothetical protein
MNRGIALLALVGICAGQTSSNARCTFYRESAFTGSALHASIRIDGGAPKHKLGAGRYWETEIAPGEHRIYGDLKRYGRTCLIEAGKTYYFRVEYRINPPTAFGKMRFRVVPIEAEIAASEMSALKPDKR